MHPPDLICGTCFHSVFDHAQIPVNYPDHPKLGKGNHFGMRVMHCTIFGCECKQCKYRPREWANKFVSTN